MVNIFIMVFVLILVAFCLNKGHVLFSLLLIEGLALVISVVLGLILNQVVISLIVVLCLAVSEAAIGLSLLVCLLRGLGNDLVKSLSIVRW